MGFKMKGSAFKLGGVKGTSGHASALKDRPKRGPEYSDNVNSKIQAHNDQHSSNPDMDHDAGDMLDGDQTWWNVKDERPRQAKMDTKYKNPDGSPKLDDQGNPLVDPSEETVPLEMKSPLEQGDPMVDPKAARTEAMSGDLGEQIKKVLADIARMEELNMTDKPGYEVQKGILADLRKKAQKPGSEASYITGESL